MVKKDNWLLDGPQPNIVMVLWYQMTDKKKSSLIITIIEFIDWKALGGDYLQVNMYKTGVDTMNAISIISKKAK